MHREMLLGAKWMPHGQRMLSRPRMQASSKLRVKKKEEKKENRASLKIIFSLFFWKYKSKIKQCKRVIRDLENHSLGPLCSYTLYFTWHEMAKHSVVRIVSHIHCFAWIILL